MKQLIEEVTGKKKYKVSIPGVTDKLPDQYSYTYTSDPEKAMANAIQRITRDVQSGKVLHRNWNYTDTGFQALMSPQYAALIIKHLKDNSGRWKAEEMK